MNQDIATELPEVYQGALQAAELALYLADLCALAGEVRLSVKRSALAYADEKEPWTLGAAFAALEAGEVRAVQLRYAHAGSAWTDTVLSGEGAYRLVRTRAHSPSCSTETPAEAAPHALP